MLAVKDGGAELEFLERPWNEGLHDDVELRQHAQEQRPPSLGLKVQRNETLVPSVDLPPERFAAGRPLPQRITCRRLLRLDDIRAEIGQQHARDAAGDHAGQIEHTDALERFHPQRIVYLFY